jgi:predicted nucleic acid-binding protein
VIHLDSNFLIDGVAPETSETAEIAAWLGAGELIACSSVVWVEFLKGPMQPDHERVARDRLLIGGILPFDEEQAALASRLFNLTGRRRALKFDCLVAAAAITSGARLATRNTEDFLPFVPHGLQLAT